MAKRRARTTTVRSADGRKSITITERDLKAPKRKKATKRKPAKRKPAKRTSKRRARSKRTGKFL